MNNFQGTPIPLGAPLQMGGAAVPKWRPVPHRWAPRARRLGQARMGQYGPLGIEFPLISLAIDVSAGAVAYVALRKLKMTNKDPLLYLTWGVLILSGLRALNDAAKLIGLVIPTGA